MKQTQDNWGECQCSKCKQPIQDKEKMDRVTKTYLKNLAKKLAKEIAKKHS